MIDSKGFTMMEVEVQEVFNLAIEEGYYSQNDRAMCYALLNMEMDGIITGEEYYYVKGEVMDYVRTLLGELHMKRPRFLKVALEVNNLPNSFEYCKKIYLDWANRP